MNSTLHGQPTPLVDGLHDALRRLDEQFTTHVAGRIPSRRDVARLDALVHDARAILARLDGIPGAVLGNELRAVRAATQGRLARFEEERIATITVQQRSADEAAFFMRAGGVQLAMLRVARNIAGRETAMRDVACLRELRRAVERMSTEMRRVASEAPSASFEQPLATVASQLARLDADIASAEVAEAVGTDEERCARLVALSRAQIDLHDACFVDRPPVTRRPALLARIITALRGIIEKRRALDGELVLVAELEARVREYEVELAMIKKARMETPLDDLLRALAEEARAVVARYEETFGGKPRVTADERALDGLCEELAELVNQMVAFRHAHSDGDYEDNVRRMASSLMRLETEYHAIRQAKGI